MPDPDPIAAVLSVPLGRVEKSARAIRLDAEEALREGFERAHAALEEQRREVEGLVTEWEGRAGEAAHAVERAMAERIVAERSLAEVREQFASLARDHAALSSALAAAQAEVEAGHKLESELRAAMTAAQNDVRSLRAELIKLSADAARDRARAEAESQKLRTELATAKAGAEAAQAGLRANLTETEARLQAERTAHDLVRREMAELARNLRPIRDFLVRFPENSRVEEASGGEPAVEAPPVPDPAEPPKAAATKVDVAIHLAAASLGAQLGPGDVARVQTRMGEIVAGIKATSSVSTEPAHPPAQRPIFAASIPLLSCEDLAPRHLVADPRRVTESLLVGTYWIAGVRAAGQLPLAASWALGEDAKGRRQRGADPAWTAEILARGGDFCNERCSIRVRCSKDADRWLLHLQHADGSHPDTSWHQVLEVFDEGGGVVVRHFGGRDPAPTDRRRLVATAPRYLDSVLSGFVGLLRSTYTMDARYAHRLTSADVDAWRTGELMCPERTYPIVLAGPEAVFPQEWWSTVLGEVVVPGRAGALATTRSALPPALVFLAADAQAAKAAGEAIGRPRPLAAGGAMQEVWLLLPGQAPTLWDPSQQRAIVSGVELSRRLRAEILRLDKRWPRVLKELDR